MVDSLIVSLRLLSFIVVLGFQLVIPQTSIEHRKVPQRIEEQSSEDSSAGIPGIWGSWGPWSACSRSCSGGVMEQTRPCLPSYYHDRAYSRPGQQYPALERTLAPQHSHHREDPLTSYSGHVISAIRTSVPLHRNEEQLQRGLWASVSSTSRNDSHLHRGTLRGSRHSQRHRTKPERRNRNQSPIGPGKYGYGKVPYILPLQTDTGQLPQKTRRQRQSTRNQAYEQNQGLGNTHNHPSNPSVQHGNLYQEERGPQVLGPSIYQQASTHSQAFPASQSLFHGTDSTHHGSASRQPFQGQPHPPRAGGIVCIGAYKQYKLCNTNMCPESSRNIREVQCASYNNKPFMGRFYEWEPFAEVKGSQKCELNCRAIGYRFYVRQAEKVIDGTPCDQNGTSVCVSGQCKSIGCDDYLGSDKVADKCGICGGDNTGCKVVSGVFKHTLTNLGYHKIVEIPEGAIKINITEMSKSNNYLALRSRSGRSIINGNWAIDRPGRYEGGGTTFTYKRPNEISSTAGESFLADGPTDEILDVYMIHQQPNPGILYEYIIPEANVISPQLPPHRRPGEPFNGQLERTDGTDHEDENLHRETDTHTGQSTGTFPVIQPGRFPSHQPDNQVPAVQPPRRIREHNWKQVGTTECTTSCGKGLRYPIFHCVNRISHEEVSESYCDTSTKPTPEEEACNIFPCPAFWDIGEWSECSKTCGLGMQHRQVLCRQVYANRTLMVQQYRCHHLEKPETTSTCQLKICSEWQIQTEWTSCSVPCGVGQRTRDVKCVSNLGDIVDDEECNMKLRPNDIENCDMGPCAKSWFLTEWSDRCSAECGAGVRTRSVVCMTNHVSSLPLEGCGNNRPFETIPCDNGPCVGKVEWFAGSWSQCSIECGSGTQQREVICIRKTEGSFDVLNPYECSFLERPPSQQPCYLKPCGAKWFNTEWSTCSKSCEGGFRVREVRCLSDDLTPSNQCDPQLKPEEKEPCNTQDCIPEIDENCKDKYYNCNVVVQARLCVYTYYKTACCASCTKVANRQSGFLGRR
ncbi:thrombospondin type-1 domain-containing protein 4 isoform X1 [Mauremys mutica]|uniref:PLAC domain-containing protein n=1 Tax=Mauremys mutica TaxID=74926 RepID=A0A9D3XPB1_9SAUR|nr:thrombospondin type-1 domain-containing protein 4 isoform X1 [Mauremys mutica]XP_044836059.1 thrombospondin type-1 domain-containing protein 4 isoform X1 [Mauremys mutica]XP_044836060.1 thrombospondin type-1 domain-containing protein 4 isoform X1 [Mauremys mutica]XP_044836061.1 thrombospondin type-1 domain-containing protein 4 isoform X1 [Mauremys mutica]XP_044836062.1 thrombospondin type-1 domain-containing protein 4 isoform X1 [Mauremys mutica]XP_044836063.1 thrombospondin type-1 domain-c